MYDADDTPILVSPTCELMPGAYSNAYYVGSELLHFRSYPPHASVSSADVSKSPAFHSDVVPSIATLLMRMAVVRVRIVRVSVLKRFMPMQVGMRSLALPFRPVCVLMMVVVSVGVVVF